MNLRIAVLFIFLLIPLFGFHSGKSDLEKMENVLSKWDKTFCKSQKISVGVISKYLVIVYLDSIESSNGLILYNWKILYISLKTGEIEKTEIRVRFKIAFDYT